VTRGPGFTSACNGLAQATLDRFPLVLVSDVVPSATSSRVMHQRLDQVAAGAPLAKWSGTLGTDDPAGVVRAATQLAMAAPAGAVHLGFDPTGPGDSPPAATAALSVDDASLERARKLLATARRPVVVVGLDAARHPTELRNALKGLDCPILVTYQAKGVIPESWPTYAGLFTGVAADRPLLEQADVVVGLGLDPVESMPGAWPTAAPVILLHSYPVDTAYFGSPLLLVGPYDTYLSRITEACRSEWDPGAGAEWRRGVIDLLEASASGLSPQQVVRATQRAMGDSTVTVDAGAHMLAVMPLWHTDDPDMVLISNGLATMGFALPAAIAAALARPHQRIVCFVGDGGLGIVLSELELLARLNLDVTVVVFNDATLSLIRLKQGEGQGGREAVGYQVVNFAAIATAMGVTGSVATDVDSYDAALLAVGSGPHLIDARVDAGCYPHIIRVVRG
jgi:acetolactate synthase-1/2/3 large subunit